MGVICIPREVKADILEENVVNFFEKLGCKIPSNCTKACHRISKKSATVIIKFSQRNSWQKCLAVKNDLLKIEMKDVDLPGQDKRFINKSFSPYFKVLWS